MKCEMLGKYIASQAEVKTSVFLSRAFGQSLHISQISEGEYKLGGNLRLLYLLVMIV
jgi:hypothetical protein